MHVDRHLVLFGRRLPLGILYSTASLVGIRSIGVAVRYFALFSLASLVSPAVFSQCGVTFLCAEFGRLITDAGLDSTYLRMAEAARGQVRQELLRRGMMIKLLQGAVALVAIEAGLTIAFGVNVLLLAIGAQFFAQSLLQLALNELQVEDRAYRAAPALLLVYGLGAAVAALALLDQLAARWGLPVIAVGEALVALWLLLPQMAWTRVADAYRTYFPQVVPMLGISLLAFMTTKTDSLLIAHFVPPAESGRYLYLGRWAELGPMIVAGFGLPLVGKIGGRASRQPRGLLLVAFGLAPMPPISLALGLVIGPNYALPLVLMALIAMISVVRVWLVIMTIVLLAHWRDQQLVLITAVSAAVTVVLGVVLGHAYGAAGVASGALLGETSNLLLQVLLVVRRSTEPRPAARP